MNDLEDRLRSDLPELAEAVLAGRPLQLSRATESPDSDEPTAISESALVDHGGRKDSGRGQMRQAHTERHRVVGLVAAFVVLVTALGGWAVVAKRGDSAQSGPATPAGGWTAIADAPIEPRSNPVMVSTGDEVIVWAGSSLDGTLAHTDGAIYDPATDTWRDMWVPGWGHPGMTGSLYANERLYVFAKGSGEAFSPETGDSIRVQHPTMSLVGAVLVSDEIWVYGVIDRSPAVVQLDSTTYEWIGLPMQAEPAIMVDDWFAMHAVARADEMLLADGSNRLIAFDTAARASGERLERGSDIVEDPIISSSLAVAGGNTGLVYVSSAADNGSALHLPDEGIGASLPFTPSVDTTIVTTENWIVVLSPGHRARAFDPVGLVWSVPGPVVAPGAAAVAVGGEIVAWGGDEGASGWRWTPQPDPAFVPAITVVLETSVSARRR